MIKIIHNWSLIAYFSQDAFSFFFCVKFFQTEFLQANLRLNYDDTNLLLAILLMRLLNLRT